MKYLVFVAVFLGFFEGFSILPEKRHTNIVPFAELKEALEADISKSPYYINILPYLSSINQGDTVAFEIEIPESWKNREVFIAFEGKGFDFSFYVNGQFIDMASDTQNLAEWRLHRMSRIGLNQLKFKALSRNNFFYQAYIYTTPKLLISNYNAESALDLSGANGILDIAGEVRNLDKRDYYKYSIEFALYDAKGKVVFSEKSPAFSFGKSKNKTKGINYHRTIMNIQKWSLSNPYLYTLIINMRDGDDNSELEILSKKIGFRTVQIIDKKLVLNGVVRPLNPVKVNLTNQQVNKDSLRAMIKSLKRSNVNLVFNDNYVPLIWFQKCLKYGILTMPDTLGIYADSKYSAFKLIEIGWIGTLNAQLKIQNLNVESDQENVWANWSLKSETRTILNGSFKITIPIGEQKIWDLPESIRKVKNLEGLKLLILVKSVNETFWHEKNFVLMEKALDFEKK